MHAQQGLTELTSPILPHPMTPTPRGSSAILKDDADLVEAAAAGSRLNEAWGRTNPEVQVAIKARTPAVDCMVARRTLRKGETFERGVDLDRLCLKRVCVWSLLLDAGGGNEGCGPAPEKFWLYSGTLEGRVCDGQVTPTGLYVGLFALITGVNFHQNFEFASAVLLR